jgi:hypothetical protein
MAVDYTKETRRTSDQVIVLEADTSQTNNRLGDNLVFKLGTNRRSELIAKITDNGKPYQAILNDYLDTL